MSNADPRETAFAAVEWLNRVIEGNREKGYATVLTAELAQLRDCLAATAPATPARVAELRQAIFGLSLNGVPIHVDNDALDALCALATPNAALREAADEIVRAATQMRDDWSESSEAVRNTMWRRLHKACAALRAALAAQPAPAPDQSAEVERLREQVADLKNQCDHWRNQAGEFQSLAFRTASAVGGGTLLQEMPEAVAQMKADLAKLRAAGDGGALRELRAWLQARRDAFPEGTLFPVTARFIDETAAEVDRLLAAAPATAPAQPDVGALLHEAREIVRVSDLSDANARETTVNGAHAGYDERREQLLRKLDAALASRGVAAPAAVGEAVHPPIILSPESHSRSEWDRSDKRDPVVRGLVANVDSLKDKLLAWRDAFAMPDEPDAEAIARVQKQLAAQPEAPKPPQDVERRIAEWDCAVSGGGFYKATPGQIEDGLALMRDLAAQLAAAEARPASCPPSELDTRWQAMVRSFDEERALRQKAEADVARLTGERDEARKTVHTQFTAAFARLREALGSDIGAGGGLVEIIDGIEALRGRRDDLTEALAAARADLERISKERDAAQQCFRDEMEHRLRVQRDLAAARADGLTVKTALAMRDGLAERLRQVEAERDAARADQTRATRIESATRRLLSALDLCDFVVPETVDWPEGELLEALESPQPAPTQGEPQAFDFAVHLQQQRDWSLRTFGPGTRTNGILDHIRKELREIESAPHDLEEWIDVVILALDGAWRAGAMPAKIIETLRAKQAKNMARQWPDWRTSDPDKAIEHTKGEPQAAAAPKVRPCVNPECGYDVGSTDFCTKCMTSQKPAAAPKADLLTYAMDGLRHRINQMAERRCGEFDESAIDALYEVQAALRCIVDRLEGQGAKP